MLKIKFWRIENVIVMKILEQGDEIKRGDFKFVASNGIKFDSGCGPMLEFGHTIWVRGEAKELDEDVAACACLSQEYARYMLKSYIEAVREYNNSLQQSVDKDSVDIWRVLIMKKFEVTITRTGSIVVEAETADEAFDKVLEMTTADIDKNADGSLTGWEPSDVEGVGTNEYADANFINDKEKMRDFKELSKKDFLLSYSYLTEQEYDNTAREMLKKLYERLKQIDDELALEYEDGETCWAANLEAEYEQTEELICKIESEMK